MGYNPKDKKFYFNNYHEFGMFCRVNKSNLRTSDDDPSTVGDLDLLGAKFEEMAKAMANTAGGCGCNIKKRQEFAETKYKETVELLSKNSIAITRLKARVFNAEEFVFRTKGSGDEDTFAQF
ncbi:MAG: hypothetical protein CMI54_05900 [Parcubacteria group bacterium]|nr:hypothetical protein [Parcubacteria group bacterium]|tara:strand:- start:16210 stop:16575 length:366 start_codon:yes stop_codon:yes gene_type:complete